MKDAMHWYQRIEITTFGDRERQYVDGIDDDDESGEWYCRWCASQNDDAARQCAQCGAPREKATVE